MALVGWFTGCMLITDLLLLAPAGIVLVLLWLRARPRFRQQTSAPPDETGPPPNAIVVDGSNVMHWGGDPSANVLSKVLRQIESAGYAPIVFFDANVGYRIGERYHNEEALAPLIGVRFDRICVVDSGVIADESILAFSRDHGLRIVTNDRYRDWRNQFPHVRHKRTLVKGTYQSGTVRLPGL